MQKVNKTPRISANKLGEYLVCKAGRQHRILYDAKFPSDFITPYYRDAEEAISQFIASNLEDISILENKIKLLGQTTANKVYQQRRILGNIESIESFMNLLDEVSLFGATPQLGARQPEMLKVWGVEISVRPEVVLRGKNSKGQATVGGIKLHFPKTTDVNEDAGGYISALAQTFCRDYLHALGAPDPKLSFVVDVSVGKIYPGIAATAKRMKDVEAACQQIAALWPSIQP